MKKLIYSTYFMLILISFKALYSEKLLIISDAPYVLDKNSWKNYFLVNNWKEDEILEADKEHIFIYLSRNRIPKGLELTKPSWGLWNIKNNTFLPLEQIPVTYVPIRKVGKRIFLRNANNTEYYYIDDTDTNPTRIQFSLKIRGWFPRYDGSIVYIIEGESCEEFRGPRRGNEWSVCIIDSELKSFEKILEVEPLWSPMLTGREENFVVYWKKNLEDKVWNLEAVDIDKKAKKIIARSNRVSINHQTAPKWLSWIQRNWVVYEKSPRNEDNENNTNNSNNGIVNRSFIVHNIITDQRKELLLERNGGILIEPGNNRKSRKYQYQPFIIIMDYSGENNLVKVVEIEELKIIFETIFPLGSTLKKEFDQAVFYP